MQGYAPCGFCGTMIDPAELTGKWEWDAERTGKDWECVPGQVCPECGRPLISLHEPSEMASDLFERINIDTVQRKD